MRKILLCLILLQFFIQRQQSLAQQVYTEVIRDPTGQGCVIHGLIHAYDNGYMLVGEYQNDGLIAKIDEQGNVLWGKRIAAQFKGYDIIRTYDSAFVVIGKTSNDGAVFCMKINAGGDTLWLKKFSGASPSNEVYRVLQKG